VRDKFGRFVKRNIATFGIEEVFYTLDQEGFMML